MDEHEPPAPKRARPWRGLVAANFRTRFSVKFVTGASERWMAECMFWLKQLPEEDQEAAKAEFEIPQEYEPPDAATTLDPYRGRNPRNASGALVERTPLLIARTNEVSAYVEQLHVPQMSEPLANVLSSMVGIVWQWDRPVAEPDYNLDPADPRSTLLSTRQSVDCSFKQTDGQTIPVRVVASMGDCFRRYDSPLPVVVLLDYRGNSVDARYVSDAYEAHARETNVVCLVLLRPMISTCTGKLVLDTPEKPISLPIPVLSVCSGMPPLQLALRVSDRLRGVATVVPVCEVGSVFHPAREPDFTLVPATITPAASAW